MNDTIAINGQAEQAATLPTIDLRGKVALVTGASRGIGQAIASEFARCGASVAVHYNGNVEGADTTLQSLESTPGTHRKYRASIEDYQQVQEMVSAVARDYGRIDILVNNAGVLITGFLSLMPLDDFKKVIDTNLTGTYHLMKAVSTWMIKGRSGTIINISSVASRMGSIGQGAYAASKAAVEVLTYVAAKELANYNIRVNALAPGCIDVGMMLDFDAKKYLPRIPSKRYGKPEEVARTAAFLASDLSSYTTGHVLYVDGGILFN